MCLQNISRYSPANDMKKTALNEYGYNFLLIIELLILVTFDDIK